MKKEDKVEIAEIVEKVIEADRKQQEQIKAANRRVRHIRRRIIIVTSVVGGIVVSHHFIHLDPVGRVGEMSLGALLSWFFDQATKREV